MNTRQAGNRAENAVCEMLQAIGYATYCARGSRGPADIVAFECDMTVEEAIERPRCGIWPKPSLVVQVGGASKPIARTLAELAAAPRPVGSLCLVARRMPLKAGRRSWKFHTPHGNFDSLEEAISAR